HRARRVTRTGTRAPPHGREPRPESGLPPGPRPVRGAQGRGLLRHDRDVPPDHLLLGPDQVQPPVDAGRQPAQLRLRRPPFFAARFRPRDARTSPSASAIRNPGGWSGPPRSALTLPRTAAQYSSTTSPPVPGATTPASGGDGAPPPSGPPPRRC